MPEVALVPVRRLREAVQQCDANRTAICERMGWTSDGTSKLARSLGEMPNQRGVIVTKIPEPLAVAILKAIHLDPVDVGI